MAIYKVGKGEVGAHAKVLTAGTVDAVRFADDLDEVEIFSDGAAAIYVTVDGSEPAVGSSACVFLPAVPCSREIPSNRVGETMVRLISAGTPLYSVAKGRES